jgi:hypothetical protein
MPLPADFVTPGPPPISSGPRARFSPPRAVPRPHPGPRARRREVYVQSPNFIAVHRRSWRDKMLPEDVLT